MRFFAVALLFGAAASSAQPPEVPQKMGFAGMTLTIREDARREIQKDVDLLTQHSRYYLMRVERAKTYFPIIEKIFDEEGVPEDFKYLVLQESALVADAVSVSNAVGFWQFKDFTALEMGLRVDKEVDERMNIISSTRGAAKYLKQSNYYFNNWLLALQAYQMGAGGVRRAVGEDMNGARNMEITADTYWYVKKFLAHKTAFENALGGEPQVKIITVEPVKRTLKEIAADYSTDESILHEYNKWLKGSSIPDDKLYTFVVPVGKADIDFTHGVLTSTKVAKAIPLPAGNLAETRRSINAIPVLAAVAGDNPVAMAERGHINLSSFLKYNDIAVDHVMKPGELYFLGRKKSKGDQDTYTLKAGEDLWAVSQHFGVRIKSLKKYNRLNDGEGLEPGKQIWLKSARPANEKIMPVEGETVALENESFDWDVQSPVEMTVVIPLASTVNIEKVNDSSEKDSMALSTEHLVKPGDTFYSIARAHGIEVTELLKWNNRTIQTGLKPGEILKVVDSEPIKVEADTTASIQTVQTTHEVKSSDTLYSIARQYGVTIKDIMDWNNKKDFSLTRGEKLLIRQNDH